MIVEPARAAPRANVSLVPIDQVAHLLASRIDALVRELLPRGHREGHEWRVGSLDGEPGQSLGVHLSGGKAGVWCDFASGQVGDALDLVSAVLCDGNKAKALAWSRRWLGLDSGDPAAIARARRQAQARAEQAADESNAEADAKRRAAHAMWLGAEADILDTPVEAYLAGRAIRLRDMANVPHALRYAPRLWCREADTYLPAMVASIADAEGRHISTHRTYLACIEGTWRKAPVRNPKLSLGPFAGGWIRLARGASGRPWTQLRGEDTVAFAEGIENALSVAVLVPEWRVAAAVSVGNFGALRLPAAMRDVVICADNDPPDSGARRAVEAAVARLQGQGRRVRVARPDAEYKDWNDQLKAECGEVTT